MFFRDPIELFVDAEKKNPAPLLSLQLSLLTLRSAMGHENRCCHL